VHQLTLPYSFEFLFRLGRCEPRPKHDRKVNINDLLLISQNYNGTGKTFSQGDLNYDGTVNFTDMLLIAQKYNTALPVPSPFNVWSTSSSQINLKLGRLGHRGGWLVDSMVR